MSNFEFNAPQFVNFSLKEDPKADKFFDLKKDPNQDSNGQTFSVTENDALGKEQSDTENQVPSSTVKSKEPQSSRKNFTVLRKVLHEIVNHQVQNDKNVSSSLSKDQGNDIIRQFEKLQLSEVKSKKSRGPVKATELFSGVKFPASGKKSHPMMTRLDVAFNRASRQSLDSLQSEESSEHQISSTTTSHQVRSTSLKRNASPLNSAKKFISLAEQVEHFHKDTPERYRSKPSKQSTQIHRNFVSKSSCMPKTPNLSTKYRQRKVDYPDEKQREEMELEEMKKHQIKAHPINEKILSGPCLNLKAPIIKKPVTVPQPFALTEVKKKEPPPEPVFHFKAQPVPSSILNGPVGIPQRRVASPTVPSTPQIKVALRFRVEVKPQEKSRSSETFSLPRNTKIEPFSFDARMRDLLQKKEEFVKKVIEEEKKTFSSFKAHPMPDFKNRKGDTPGVEKSHQKTVPQPFNLTQCKGTKLFSEEPNPLRVTPFKARTASVLHQKPFVPKFQKCEIQPPSEFHLNTEKRAVERQKFDEKIKQKEEEISTILKLRKEEEEKMEKEMMLEERKKTEFKAAPMPRYKVFEVYRADPEKLTLPQSPAFSSKTRKPRARVEPHHAQLHSEF